MFLALIDLIYYIAGDVFISEEYLILGQLGNSVADRKHIFNLLIAFRCNETIQPGQYLSWVLS